MSSKRGLRAFLVGVSLLAVCAAPARVAANNCAGGGKPRPDEGGVGGTGLQEKVPDDDGGIGGTGISARGDTGIIGTITGFASICVGGVEIRYGADTPVRMDGRGATSAQLAVGQVVEVIAAGKGSEVSAQEITVRHVVSGPVTRVDAARNEIDVIGQTVRLSSLMSGVDANDQSATTATAFPLHSSVQVNGMRRSDAVIMASRVSRGEDSEFAQLVGPVAKVDPAALQVGGTTVRSDAHPNVSVGDEVRVVGRWDGSAVVAYSVEAIPRVPFDGRVTRVEIEGYAWHGATGQLQVGGYPVEVSPSATGRGEGPPTANTSVRIQAVVRDRRVIVERIRVINEPPSLQHAPQVNPRGWNGRGPDDWRDGSGAAAPMDQPGPDGHDGAPLGRGPDAGPPGRDGGAPPRPDRGDRPPAAEMPDQPMQMPDRPPMPDRPQAPDRPQIPDRPQMPDRPQIPDRPPMPDRPPRFERPPLPPRPEIHGRS